jgi:hypothetical protein
MALNESVFLMIMLKNTQKLFPPNSPELAISRHLPAG